MAYDAFDAAHPVISDTRLNVVDYARKNLVALTHMVMSGGAGNLAWAFSQSGGTTAKPTTMLLSNGTQRVRWTLTWGGTGSNYITAITAAYSSDSGTNYDTIGTFTYTYTSDELTGGNVGSLALAALVWQIGRALDVIGDLATHAALTGTSAHGLANMATQANTAVNIDGGTVDGVSIGTASVATDIAANRSTAAKNTYSPGSGAAVVIDFTKASSEIVNNGTNSVTFSNVPGSGRFYTHVMEVSNLNNTTGNLSSTTIGPGAGNPWGVGGKPSKAGRCLVAIDTDDGGASYTFRLLWSAV